LVTDRFSIILTQDDADACPDCEGMGFYWDTRNGNDYYKENCLKCNGTGNRTGNKEEIKHANEDG